tara:strand:+ start:138 stop:992 length:855 start_codon:yes stop_codon:yes gene_type:complete
MIYRSKNSINYKQALNEFGNQSLLHIDQTNDLKINLLLSCVGPHNHLKSIKNLKNKANLVAVEKPISLNLNEIRDFENKESIFVLMNRRYYSWVPKIKELIKSNSVHKIIANIPEKRDNEIWNNMPISLIKNSIHIFDLIYYLCDGFENTLFKNLRKSSSFFLTKSKNIEEIFFHINFDYVEKFSIKFYLKDNSIIECSPIEKAIYYENFEITEPTKNDFIRKFNPIAYSFTQEKIHMEYQKPGILNLCKDLLSYEKDSDKNKIKLPNMNESLNIMQWLKNIYE